MFVRPNVPEIARRTFFDRTVKVHSILPGV